MLSKNLLNQAMAVAHQAAMTDIQIELDAGILLAALQVGTEVQEGDEIRATLLPSSPAYIELTDNVDGIGRLFVTDASLELELKAQDGTYNQVAIATVDMDAPFFLSVTANNGLAPSITGQARLNVQKIKLLGSIPWSPGFTEDVALLLLPGMLPGITQAIGAIQVPSIIGYTPAIDEMWVIDEEKQYIAMTGRLVPEVLVATAPSTHITISNASLFSLGIPETSSNTAIFTLDSDNPTAEALEYRYQLDAQPWSAWSSAETFTLYDLLPGEHTMMVCARTFELVEEESCPSITFITH